jgi:hypothetical protein
MGRVAASAGPNIAEGCGRRWEGEMRGFLEIGCGSANEPEYHLLVGKELHLLEKAEFRDLEARVLVQRGPASSAAGVKVSTAGRKLTSISQRLADENLLPA